ncbi:efflux RND transporter periplasmic adaptor subunit [Thalassotalea fusca]
MRYLSWTLTVVITALTVSGLFVYKQAQSAESANQSNYEPAIAVEVSRTKAVTFQQTRAVSGTIKPKNHLIIKNELAGKIAKIHVASGEVVEEGQVLLVIEHDEESAQLAAAKARLKLSQLTLSRFQTLARSERISKEKVDAAQSDVAIAKADVARIESLIARKTLRAPFEAFVGIHDLKEGEYLDTNEVVVELVGTEREVWVDFYLPQTYPLLMPKSTVKVTFVGSKAQEREATIVTRAKHVSVETRQLHYRATLTVDHQALVANQLVRVTVPVTEPVENLAIPALAIVRDQSGDYVYQLNADSEGTFRAEKVKVKVAVINRQQAVISQGVTDNTLVATKGAFKLYPGAKTHFDQSIANVE